MVRSDSGQDAQPEGVAEVAIPKASTGIAGLDEILHGGIPRGRTTLISGGPGSGKTVLALETLVRAAWGGEPGIFVSFEEDAEAIRRNALSMGWDLAPLERAGVLFVMEGQTDPEAVQTGDFNIRGLLAILEGQTSAMGARRVVVDAADVLLRFLADPSRERDELYALHHWLLRAGLTAIITVKGAHESDSPGPYRFLDYAVDCVLRVDQRIAGQISTRRLRVLKYRGSSFDRNEYPFAIGAGGIRLVPLSGISPQHVAPGEMLSTGNASLDAVLGGGLRRATIALFAGASGTGKTSLVSTFACAACARGERVLYASFEQSQEALVADLRSAGIDLRPALESGMLRFDAAMPEALGVEEHLIRLLDLAEAFGPDHLVVDAISATTRMSTPQAAFDFVVRLTGACRERGITCLLTNQTGQNVDHEVLSGIGVSSIIDTIVMLNYVESQGALTRRLLVLKSRGARHSMAYHDFLITDDGIDVVTALPRGQHPNHEQRPGGAQEEG